MVDLKQTNTFYFPNKFSIMKKEIPMIHPQIPTSFSEDSTQKKLRDKEQYKPHTTLEQVLLKTFKDEETCLDNQSFMKINISPPRKERLHIDLNTVSDNETSSVTESPLQVVEIVDDFESEVFQKYGTSNKVSEEIIAGKTTRPQSIF